MAVTWRVSVAGQAPWSSAVSAVTRMTSGNSTSNASGYTSGNARSGTMSSSFSSSGVTTTADSRTSSFTRRAASGETYDGIAGTSSSSDSGSSASGQTVVVGTITIITGSAGSSSNSYSAVTAYGSTTSRVSRYTTNQNSAGVTTSSSTQTGVATASYNAATAATATVQSRVVSITRETTRSIITKHSASSLSSTQSASQTYTETIASFVSTNTTRTTYVTSSYITGGNHLQTVVQAGRAGRFVQAGYLRRVTTTASVLTGMQEILGPAEDQITLSAAAGQISYGAAVGEALSTFTTSVVVAWPTPTTLTEKVLTDITITLGASDGWVGGTETRTESIRGFSTQEVFYDIPDQLSTIGTGLMTARLSYSTVIAESLSQVSSDTITGINSAGLSSTYEVQYLAHSLVTYSSIVRVSEFIGTSSAAHLGYSATVFTSPSPPAFSSPPIVHQSRLERAFGYQHASSIGPNGGRGASVSANSLFFIGTDNYVMADPNGVLIPAPVGSTAETENSSYSFLAGANGAWTVTALRTDSSSNTLTTFTASVGTAGAAELFINQSANWWPEYGAATVLGGHNALTGIPQKVTFEGGIAGYKYTIRNSASTTSYTTHLESYATATISTNMIAVETFSATPPHGPVATHQPISFVELPFNQ